MQINTTWHNHFAMVHQSLENIDVYKPIVVNDLIHANNLTNFMKIIIPPPPPLFIKILPFLEIQDPRKPIIVLLGKLEYRLTLFTDLYIISTLKVP